MARETPPQLKARHRIKVRYAETDQMGIVYHANYLIWFHEARDALIRHAGLSPAEIEQQGWQFPVVEASCRYYASARYGDEVDIQAMLAVRSVARMDFTYLAIRAGCGTKLVSGTTRTAVTDASGKLVLRT
ncbi:acyl-CoA thioesterase, partial [Leisingera sp. ANG-M1]|uniref:acyl-CoA thioesterase n=1 Tax=Leisingera sp. ANG-M1 TaxID=1577895 RepID=UPI0009E2C244